MPLDRSVPDAVRQLTNWIATTRYPLHSRLPPERELATLLQMPRSKVRQALKLMEDEGRIWRRVGMGTFVGSRPRSTGSAPESFGAATTLSEILEARSLIEPLVARLAAQRAAQADIALIERYALAANRAQSWTKWEKWDELLHRAFAEASGNGVLISAVDQLFRIRGNPKWTMQQAGRFDSDLILRYGREHKAIISCIIGGDGGGAEAAMRRHMLGLRLTVGPAITHAGGTIP